MLFTAWVIRENAQTLYAFHTAAERDLFELLITLSGIGPKTALAMVGRFEPDELALVVHEGKSPLLAKVPGIGKKTAERLVIDLKGKLGPIAAAASLSIPASTLEIHDALAALMNLGYSQESATKAVRGASEELGPKATLSELITVSLKYFR